MHPKTSLEIVLTPPEAEQHQRTIHRAICLLNELPSETAGAFERAQLRADLLRLAARLDDAVVPSVPPPARDLTDPFTPEGNGSAQDILLGRLVSVCSLVLGVLSKSVWPVERTVIQQTQQALLRDWHEYEELSRG